MGPGLRETGFGVDRVPVGSCVGLGTEGGHDQLREDGWWLRRELEPGSSRSCRGSLWDVVCYLSHLAHTPQVTAPHLNSLI